MKDRNDKPPTPADLLRVMKEEGIIPKKMIPGLHTSIKAVLCCPACGSTTQMEPKSAAEALIWICLVCSEAWQVDPMVPATRDGATAIMGLRRLNLPTVRPDVQ